MTKQIELFDGYKIEVSDDGKIYTPEYIVLRKNGRNFLHKKKEIKPSIDKYGYYRICLSYNNKRKNYSVHRLVAMAFIPNPENKPTVNHKNGIKTDNHVYNLEWATQKEQKEHSIKNHLCDKNVECLRKANEKKKKPIILNGVEYESIRAARRATGLAEDTIKKYGKEVMPNEKAYND